MVLASPWISARAMGQSQPRGLPVRIYETDRQAYAIMCVVWPALTILITPAQAQAQVELSLSAG